MDGHARTAVAALRGAGVGPAIVDCGCCCIDAGAPHRCGLARAARRTCRSDGRTEGRVMFFRRRPSDDEMREELEAHIAMRAEHDGGDEAAARRRLGNVLHTREAMRRVWIAQWWDALLQDAHFTWRSWRRRPGFALGAVLVLALGLGAATAMFSAVDRILFRPLPYGDADRLVNVGIAFPGVERPGQSQVLLHASEYLEQWKPAPEPFTAVTTTADASHTCDVTEQQPERLL